MLENNIIAISKEKAKISNSSILNNGISSF